MMNTFYPWRPNFVTLESADRLQKVALTDNFHLSSWFLLPFHNFHDPRVYKIVYHQYHRLSNQKVNADRANFSNGAVLSKHKVQKRLSVVLKYRGSIKKIYCFLSSRSSRKANVIWPWIQSKGKISTNNTEKVVIICFLQKITVFHDFHKKA